MMHCICIYILEHYCRNDAGIEDVSAQLMASLIVFWATEWPLFAMNFSLIIIVVLCVEFLFKGDLPKQRIITLSV